MAETPTPLPSNGFWNAISAIGVSLIGTWGMVRIFTMPLPLWSSQLIEKYGIGMIVTFIGLVLVWYYVPRNILTRSTELKEMHEQMLLQQAVLADSVVKVNLIYGMLQSRIGELVKAQTHTRLDGLMDRYNTHTATTSELEELKSLLNLRSLDDVTVVQSKAVSLSLLFVSEELLQKLTAEEAGVPWVQAGEPPARQEVRPSQEEAERLQVLAGERKPKDSTADETYPHKE